MPLTDAQSADLRKIAHRLNVNLLDLLALGDDVLAMLLDPNASHELLADKWYTDEGDPEYEQPFSCAEVRAHPRTGEPFAVAHGYATKLDTLLPVTAEAKAAEFRSEPLLIGGRAVVWWWGSVLCLCQHKPRPHKPLWRGLQFQRRGWLHEKELDMPEQEVRERIGAEIDNGTLTLLPQRG